jgi:hypothetical protein
MGGLGTDVTTEVASTPVASVKPGSRTPLIEEASYPQSILAPFDEEQRIKNPIEGILIIFFHSEITPHSCVADSNATVPGELHDVYN